MCYYITNKRENGMTTMIETAVHFVSLSAKVSFSLEKRLFLRLFAVNTYKIRQGITCSRSTALSSPKSGPNIVEREKKYESDLKKSM